MNKIQVNNIQFLQMSKQILLSLAVCLMVASIGNCSRAFIYPFEQEEQSSQNFQSISQHEVSQLIKYNLGLSEHVQSEDDGHLEDLIKAFGKGNVYAPNQMTYVMVLQSDLLIEQQENKQARITEGYSAAMRVTEKTQKSVMDLLFADNEFSMVNRAQRHFKSESEPRLPFIIYQNEDDLDVNFLHWTVTLYINQNKEVFLYEPSTDKSFKIESNLEKCVDFFFGSTFDYSPADDKIYKYNTDDLINITPENQDLFLGFFKDICAMNKLSQTFKRGKTPNFMAVINKSVSKLEKVLKEDEITLVYDMMRIAHKKMSKNLRNYFEQDDLFGVIIVEEEKNPQVTTTKEAAKVQRILMETRSRMLNQASETSGTYLATATTMSPGTFQIYVWFGVFLLFVLYFVLYSLMTMEVTKDTLLYAKFLTNDARA